MSMSETSIGKVSMDHRVWTEVRNGAVIRADVDNVEMVVMRRDLYERKKLARKPSVPARAYMVEADL